MSSMLEQAIVDAKALKEAAIKSAETELLQKYSEEMKQAVTSLLEAEADLGMEPAPVSDAPPAYAAGENLCPCPEQEEEFVVDFSTLRSQAEEEADAGDEISLGDELTGGDGMSLGDEEDELSLEEQKALEELFNEDVVLDIVREMEADEEEEEESDKEESVSSDSEGVSVDALEAGFQKKEEALQATISELVERLKKRITKQKEYETIIKNLTGRLSEVNLANAKLIYTNRVLINTSLNERQKNKIVESIASADSVSEAKTIFETLQNAVNTSTPAKKQAINSLSEAVKRNSSPYAIRGNGKEPQNLNDAFSDRMRRLAGIKN